MGHSRSRLCNNISGDEAVFRTAIYHMQLQYTHATHTCYIRERFIYRQFNGSGNGDSLASTNGLPCEQRYHNTIPPPKKKKKTTTLWGLWRLILAVCIARGPTTGFKIRWLLPSWVIAIHFDKHVTHLKFAISQWWDWWSQLQLASSGMAAAETPGTEQRLLCSK